MKYIYPEPTINATSYAGNVYATYYILFNSLIPLALLISLEIGKLAYSRIMEDDLEMKVFDQNGSGELFETRV